MSDLTGITSGALSQLGAGSAQDNEKEKLGQADFLELLVAQISNQNPLEPQSNAEFLSQMAQFSTVDGIQQLNSSFAGLSGSLTSNQALQASSLVGRSVMVPSNQFSLAENGSASGAVNLSDNVSALAVSIFNSSGEVVRQINLGAQASGSIDFAWDGKLTNGKQAPAGQYTFSAQGLSGTDTKAYSTSILAKVESVSLSNGTNSMLLNVGGIGKVNFNDVTQIK